MKSLKSLSDNSLLNQLNKLVKQEHDLTLDILPHLLEVEDRGLHLRAGYSSLFKYCVEFLGFSESTAVRRIRAARCAGQFPEVFRLLEQRKIKIVDVAKIKSVISDENREALLAEVVGKTQKQIEEIVAMYGQPKVVPEIVRVVKVAKPAETPHALAASATLSGRRCQRAVERQETYRQSGGNKSCTSEQERYEKKFCYSFTVSEELNGNIQKCKILLSGKYPTGVSQEVLLHELTEMFLDRKDPERRAERREKRKLKPSMKTQESGEPSRHISPTTQDKVYNRDGGRCTYMGSNGKRCNSTWNLEIHHDGTAFAHGGDHSVKNLKLLCAAHNRLESERTFPHAKHFRKHINQKE